MSDFEHFATKGIQSNLKAPRSLDDPSGYYPITTYLNDSHRGSMSLLGAFLAGMALGGFVVFMLPVFLG